MMMVSRRAACLSRPIGMTSTRSSSHFEMANGSLSIVSRGRMIFFTRELYLGFQPNSGWERRAENEWYRRMERYREYEKVIFPMLPAAVRRLCRQGLHDGVVTEAGLEDGDLTMEVDATNALSGFRGRLVRLTFRGV